eukprot:Clim_evm62s109 gene=Clim_evmTU62s109
MSKLSFRARTLEYTRPLPIYKLSQLPDLDESANISRAVPQLPTGMEKEEEEEHHLQAAISSQQALGKAKKTVIPTPDVKKTVDYYETMYKTSFTQPKHYIRVADRLLDKEQPLYDIDDDDEEWITKFNKQRGNADYQLSIEKFEELIDLLERIYPFDQRTASFQEMRNSMEPDQAHDNVAKAVFEYWLAKRKKLAHPVRPRIKTEKHTANSAASANDPYVAFRRRSERIQTRKNRQRDEINYEKIIRLQRDFERLKDLVSAMKDREQTKLKRTQLAVEIFERRFQLNDWTEKKPAEEDIKGSKAAKKKKKLDKAEAALEAAAAKADAAAAASIIPVEPVEEQRAIAYADDFQSSHAFKKQPKGQYFMPTNVGVRRTTKPSQYFWPVGNSNGTNGSARKNLGFARRRIGRGGRIWIDRGHATHDQDEICFEGIASVVSRGPLGALNGSALDFDEERRQEVVELIHAQPPITRPPMTISIPQWEFVMSL